MGRREENELKRDETRDAKQFEGSRAFARTAEEFVGDPEAEEDGQCDLRERGRGEDQMRRFLRQKASENEEESCHSRSPRQSWIR